MQCNHLAFQLLIPLPVLSLLNALLHHKGSFHFHPGLQQDPKGNTHPKPIEENEIQPHVNKIMCSKLSRASQPLRRKGHKTSIKLRSCKHSRSKPKLSLDSPTHLRCKLAIGLHNQITNIDSSRSTQDNSQKLQRHDGDISASPATISLSVFLPQTRKGTGAVRGTVVAIGPIEEEGFCAVDAGDGSPAREAFPQEGTLNEDVCQGIVGVPGEEEAVATLGFIGGEEVVGEEVGGWHHPQGEEETYGRGEVHGECGGHLVVVCVAVWSAAGSFWGEGEAKDGAGELKGKFN